MKAQTLLLVSLNTRWDKYQTELKTCRREFSEEAVHDFRVTTRRLLSALDLLRAVIHDPGIQKTRRILKDQLDDLDDLRDAQALLADISENIHETPNLQPFKDYLRPKEKHLMRLAHKDIKSLKMETLSKRIQRLNQTIKEFKQTDLNTSVFSAVDEAYVIVNQRYALVDANQPATIHHLRIAFKKFRYMIEVIYPFLENLPLDYLKGCIITRPLWGIFKIWKWLCRNLLTLESSRPPPMTLSLSALIIRNATPWQYHVLSRIKVR
jgi:CHAD domain-containing protein